MDRDIEQIMPRETAVQKAGVCDTCGSDVPAVTTVNGFVTAGVCPSCATEPILDAQKAAAKES